MYRDINDLYENNNIEIINLNLNVRHGYTDLHSSNMLIRSGGKQNVKGNTELELKYARHTQENTLSRILIQNFFIAFKIDPSIQAWERITHFPHICHKSRMGFFGFGSFFVAQFRPHILQHIN